MKQVIRSGTLEDPASSMCKYTVTTPSTNLTRILTRHVMCEWVEEVCRKMRQKCDVNAYLAELGKRVRRPRSAARRWRRLQVLISKEWAMRRGASLHASKDWGEGWDVGEVGSGPTWNGGSGASWNLLCKILLWSGLTIKYHKELLVDSLKGNWKSYLQETTTILSKRELCNTWSFATFPWSLKGIIEHKGSHKGNHKGSHKGNVHHNHHKGNYNCFSSLCSCSWYSFSWYVIQPQLSLTMPQWRLKPYLWEAKRL